MPTPEQVQALKSAMWQLLDDMSPHGLSVCRASKAQARLAFEPFINRDDPDDLEACNDFMSVEDAKRVLRECGQL